MFTLKERDALIEEAKLWRRMRHSNVLDFYGIHFHSCDDIYLVSPWVENGSLTDYIANNPEADRVPLVRPFCYRLKILSGLLRMYV